MGEIEKQYLKKTNEDFKKASLYWKACAKYESWRIKTSREFWLSLSGVRFKRELGNLFVQLGYQVNYTPQVADGGVDLILRKDEKLTIVQCKA